MNGSTECLARQWESRRHASHWRTMMVCIWIKSNMLLLSNVILISIQTLLLVIIPKNAWSINLMFALFSFNIRIDRKPIDCVNVWFIGHSFMRHKQTKRDETLLALEKETAFHVFEISKKEQQQKQKHKPRHTHPWPPIKSSSFYFFTLFFFEMPNKRESHEQRSTFSGQKVKLIAFNVDSNSYTHFVCLWNNGWCAHHLCRSDVHEFVYVSLSIYYLKERERGIEEKKKAPTQF